MSLSRKHFLFVIITFVVSLMMVLVKGTTLNAIIKLTISAAPVFVLIPTLVVSGRIINFLYCIIKGLCIHNVYCFNHWDYDFKTFANDVLNTCAVCLWLISLVLFQSLFKSIYAWDLITPNNLDWLLSTLDRIFTGPSLWWWGSQILSSRAWVGFVIFLDRFYMLYFALQWFVLMYLLFDDRSSQKEYFVTLFLGVWVYGTTLGGVCQSGGPFFFSYSAWNLMQMKALFAIHSSSTLYAIQLQSYLWESYFNQQLFSFAGGISAFPSLHVAMCFFSYIYISSFNNKYVTWFTLAGLVLTIMGSSILGWHYLADSIGAFFVIYLAKKTATVLHKS